MKNSIKSYLNPKTLGLTTLLAASTLGTTGQTIAETFKDQEPTKTEKGVSGVNSITPTWKNINLTSIGLPDSAANSLEFYHPTGASEGFFVVGTLSGAAKISHDSIVKGFGPFVENNSALPVLTNGYACHMDADTLRLGTQYNGGIGGLFKRVSDTISSRIPNFTIKDITCIKKNPQGQLMVGTSGDGIFILSDTNIVSHITTNNSGLSSDVVKDIVFKNNVTYTTTGGGGLAIFDGTNRVIHNGTTTGFGNNFNYNPAINIDKNGVIWTGGINFFKFENNQRSQIPKPTRMTGTINKIESDQFGNVIVASSTGIGIYNTDLGTWDQFDNTNSPFSSNNIKGLAIDTNSLDSMEYMISSSSIYKFSASIIPHLPSAPANLAITGEDSIQIGQTYTYSLSAPVTNGVKYERTCTDPNVTLVANGTSVDATFTPGCHVPATITCKISNSKNNAAHPALQVSTTVLDNTVSTGEQEKPAEVKVYPNPTVDLIHVLGLEQEKIVSVKIYNMNWQEVASQKVIPGQEVNVNVQNLAPGTYILMCQDEEGNGHQSRFIKQ